MSFCRPQLLEGQVPQHFQSNAAATRRVPLVESRSTSKVLAGMPLALGPSIIVLTLLERNGDLALMLLLRSPQCSIVATTRRAAETYHQTVPSKSRPSSPQTFRALVAFQKKINEMRSVTSPQAEKK